MTRQEESSMDNSSVLIKLEPVSPRVSGNFSSVTDSEGGLDQEIFDDDVFGSTDIKDDRLKTAVTNSWMQKQLTPLLKEELRATILKRRHAKGQGEIEFKKPKPAPKRELTEDERRRKLRRKEQNRRAATKCRHKKKAIQENLKVAYEKERKKASALQTEIETLNKEKAELERILHDHHPACVHNAAPQSFNEFNMSTPFGHQQGRNYQNHLCLPYQSMYATSPPYTTDNELCATSPNICATSPNICATSPSLYGTTQFDFDAVKMAEKSHTVTTEVGFNADENFVYDEISLGDIPGNPVSSCLDLEEDTYNMNEINALLDGDVSLSLNSDDLNSVVANALGN